MAKPVFGWSNKRGTVVVMDDGTVWEQFGAAWKELPPLPHTPRFEEREREEADIEPIF